MERLADRGMTRREWLALTAGACATLALRSPLLAAISEAKLIQREIPATGEKLPIIGVQFRNSIKQDPAALKNVVRTLIDNGGRFVDTMHQSMPGVEDMTVRVVTDLGVREKLFLGLRAHPPGPLQTDGALVRQQIDGLLKKLATPKLDLVQLPSHAAPGLLAELKRAKEDGSVRYIAVTTIVNERHGEIESLMRNEPIDFIGVHYSMDNVKAAEKLLPLAQERKIGVIAYFPFGVGALFQRAGSTPLPEWAAEFDAKTWAQFFLKYVVSHPAVTLVRAGTTQPAHMLDNIGGGIGRLPDEATRKRMLDLVNSWPMPKRPAGPGKP
ncbi:MAG TPA: aldo/keto reductase [Phycisphaerales bacterium]